MRNTQTQLVVALVSALFAAGCSQQANPTRGLFDRFGASTVSPTSSLLGSMFGKDNPDKLYRQARELEQHDDLAGAGELYAKIVEKWPDHADAHHRLAVVYDQSGRSKVSQAHYQMAMKLKPRDAHLKCDAGYSQYLRGNLVAAEQLYRDSLILDPNLDRAHNNLGQLLARKGQVDEAEGHFLLAGCSIREASENSDLAIALARSLGELDYSTETQLATVETESEPSVPTQVEATNEAPQVQATQYQQASPSEIQVVQTTYRETEVAASPAATEPQPSAQVASAPLTSKRAASERSEVPSVKQVEYGPVPAKADTSVMDTAAKIDPSIAVEAVLKAEPQTTAEAETQATPFYPTTNRRVIVKPEIATEAEQTPPSPSNKLPSASISTRREMSPNPYADRANAEPRKEQPSPYVLLHLSDQD